MWDGLQPKQQHKQWMDGVSGRSACSLGLAGSRKYRERSPESLVSVKVLAGLVCWLKSLEDIKFARMENPM